jgi:hypothetical protein
MPQERPGFPHADSRAYKPRFSVNYRVLAHRIIDWLFPRDQRGAGVPRNVAHAIEEAILLGRIQGLDFALRFNRNAAKRKRLWLTRRIANDSSTATPGAKKTFLRSNSHCEFERLPTEKDTHMLTQNQQCSPKTTTYFTPDEIATIRKAA